ncbi:hypothetical protein HA466_0008060 [Hirschfeldia incana]|nr:hypothetical protein HA466_0008060 [Hirschfeldia incana]
MVVTRDLELQYRETKEVRKIRMIDMDGGITIAGFVEIHGISYVKEMEYCKGKVFLGIFFENQYSQGQENQNQRKYEEEKGDPLNHQSIFSGKGVTFELRYSCFSFICWSSNLFQLTQFG